MDNELVNGEVITEATESIDVKAVAKQALPIAGGIGLGVIGGYLLCRFVVKPLLAKWQEKKAAEAKVVDGETREES